MNAIVRSLLANPVEADLSSPDESLLAQHDRYFSTVRADAPALREVKPDTAAACHFAGTKIETRSNRDEIQTV